MNIGIMGGTFDPVHLGHLAVAEEARRQLNMAEVVFVPAGRPYFKAAFSISSAEHRLKMLDLALADKPYFRISRIELDRPGPSYAIDTLSDMKKELGPDDELYFILGWDALMSLPYWQDPQKLINICRLVAAPRPGFPAPDIHALDKLLPGIAQRAVVMDRPVMDISSTDIRQRVKDGLPIDHLVPKLVAEYIKEKGLYRK
jgi:nicotinate-nucleotide adenylyltransferase